MALRRIGRKPLGWLSCRWCFPVQRQLWTSSSRLSLVAFSSAASFGDRGGNFLSAGGSTTWSIQFARREFATPSKQKKQVVHGNGSTHSVETDAELLFARAKRQLINRHGHVDYNLCKLAVYRNAIRHQDPARGLANAIELAKLVANGEHGVTLMPKAWEAIFVRMISMQYPIDEMIQWMETHSIENYTRSMIYVLSVAFEKIKQVDVALQLLEYIIKNQTAKTTAQEREMMMSYLLRHLLNANPSIEQVEAYVRLYQSSRRAADELTSARIMAYYMDPSHHEANRPLKDIARSTLELLRQHRYVLRWHSSLCLPQTGEAWMDEDQMESNCVELERQLESLVKMNPQAREEYFRIVRCELSNSTRLYAMALKRASSCDPAPFDYDVCVRAIVASVHDRAHPTQGLARGVELAYLMADRPGFSVSAKTWSSMLLRMVENEYPVDQITRWMNTQPVENLTFAMVYVLSNALKDASKRDIVVVLLRQWLQKVDGKAKRDDRRAVLSFLLDAFLKTRPPLEQLDQYIGFMAADQVQIKFFWRRAIVSFFVNPAQHDPSSSTREIAVRFMDFWRKHEALLAGKGHSVRSMGSMLGASGSNGVRVAKELLEAAFIDDHGNNRRGFAEAVLRHLKYDGDAKMEFVHTLSALGITVHAGGNKESMVSQQNENENNKQGEKGLQ